MRSLSALPAPLLILLSSLCLTLALADHEPSVEIDITTPATCSRPSKSGDEIAVHYRGTLQSTGDVFDESYKRGQPITFRLGAGQVIKGWDEGLQDMCPGEARTLTIPSKLAYGAYGSPPVIPGGATLIFETELVDIVGVEQESLIFSSSSASFSSAAPSSATSFLAAYSSAAATAIATATEESFTIATAPSTPPEDDKAALDDLIPPTIETTPLTPDEITAAQQAKCHLLGPLALIVQGALGAVALLSLVFKRWRETPKRPWKIWFFDVSKQVFGSMLVHVLNLAMSMFGSVDVVNAAAQQAASQSDENGRTPNPCSFYTLNIGIDTTIGILVLYILLKALHGLFRYTPLAKPPESIKSGHYGQPPKVTWWIKQVLIYFIGLTGMKLFVFFLFAALPWLPWVGDWALRWTEDNEALQIAFTLFIFPLAMNVIQYWIIDSFIMERHSGPDGAGSYQQVQGDYDEENDGDDDDTITQVEEDVRGKGSGGSSPPLMDANPTPVPSHNESEDGSRENGHKVRTD